MILITGMQRSGTSMVCQLLAALGVSFGDPAALARGDRWNPAGYFEVRAVMDVNSRIITGRSRHGSRLGAWWSKVVYLCMPAAAAIAARADQHRAAITKLGESYRSGALKDPRFCLTLGYWRQWTDVNHVVVCVRDPAAVVRSLQRRHWLPRWLGARFYAWHVQALLDQLPADGVVFVDVDRLFAHDARELDALRRVLSLDTGPSSAGLLHDIVHPGPDDLPGVAAACPRAAQAAFQRLTARAAAQRAAAAQRRPW